MEQNGSYVIYLSIKGQELPEDLTQQNNYMLLDFKIINRILILNLLFF